MYKDKSGRKIEAEFDGDIGDAVECTYAEFVNPNYEGEEVPDETIDYLIETYADDIEHDILMNKVGAAEAAWDASRGH